MKERVYKAKLLSSSPRSHGTMLLGLHPHPQGLHSLTAGPRGKPQDSQLWSFICVLPKGKREQSCLHRGWGGVGQERLGKEDKRGREGKGKREWGSSCPVPLHLVALAGVQGDSHCIPRRLHAPNACSPHGITRALPGVELAPREAGL